MFLSRFWGKAEGRKEEGKEEEFSILRSLSASSLHLKKDYLKFQSVSMGVFTGVRNHKPSQKSIYMQLIALIIYQNISFN